MSETPEVDGFVVAGYEHGRLVIDWDGEVHPDRDAGDLALSGCHTAGYRDYSLFALSAVTPGMVARKQQADAAVVDELRQLAYGNRKTVRVDELRSILGAHHV